MNKSRTQIVNVLTITGILLITPSVSKNAFAGGNTTNSTAQSVMFDTSLSGTFVMTNTEVFEYQKDVAATYFTNAWDGVVPTGQIQGQAHGTTAPVAPSAPPPIDQFVNGSVGSNQCTFFRGGTLAAQGNTFYSQNLYKDVPYQSGTGGKNPTCTTKNDTYKYVYNYAITVNTDTANVAPLTAWSLSSNTPGEPVTVNLSGKIAAETTVKKSKGNDPWTSGL